MIHARLFADQRDATTEAIEPPVKFMQPIPQMRDKHRRKSMPPSRRLAVSK